MKLYLNVCNMNNVRYAYILETFEYQQDRHTLDLSYQ